MANYECRHVAGRQFVFEEQPRWVFLGLVAVMLIGMLIGLLLGLIIGMAGIFSFEILMVGLAAFFVYDSYDLTFVKKSGAHDNRSFFFALTLIGAIFAIFMVAMRYSAFLDTPRRCMLFSVCGIGIGLVAYAYGTLCLQEDQRKHHLGLCSPEGEPEGDVFLRTPSPQEEEVAAGGLEALQRFVSWIGSGQWCYDINDWSVPAAEDCVATDQVFVHNRTLKLIKVCLYSSHDPVCWIPIGGIAGSCVGFIRAGEKRAFTLPRPWTRSAESKERFRLKVFMPGLLDKELASHSRAERGQTFAFTDVEGMVRRSRLLSSSSADSEPRTPTESSEDEGLDAPLETLSKGAKLAPLSPLQRNCGGSSLDLIQTSSGMRRSLSQSPTSTRCSSESGSRDSAFSPGKAISFARKAAPNEIVVRNRSNQEIRAVLFRSNDYCYMVPLVGKLLQCGDVILPSAERRFDPEDAEENDFTLKVYSVGSGARELTYLTASRGNTYVFLDSLLS
eukprot:TRINITY_DN36317_c0_g1_i1.p1 TRINITY_DN36317_c0_g1~~TRINITY_DN36317_c0_g1_i1.p1  ORF type:complete len:524 (+),score=75.68 TRINITY_DN36317_c0_g1_i1:68-1573(+)